MVCTRRRYGPSVFSFADLACPVELNAPAIPCDAAPSTTDRVVPFTAADGMPLHLIHVQGEQPPHRGPVLLVHGAGVRAHIFRAPVQTTIVDALLDAGYDVWLENWRASIDVPPTPWNLDEAAAYDHPKAVEKVVAETGHDTIKAIIHCQGSTSFMMSAVAGLMPQVTTIVSNAVALHPVVPRFSEFKMNVLLPLVRPFTTYMNPQWGKEAPTPFAKAIRALVNLTHHECDNGVCKQVSFTYGSGFPALWSHANLNDATHEWLKDEFAEVPLRFYEQIVEGIKAGHLVSMPDADDTLPTDYVAEPPQTDARFTFFAGEDNLCFLPESQVKTFEYFDALEPDRHRLHVLPRYGHLDVFMGARAAEDIFPLMIDALNRD